MESSYPTIREVASTGLLPEFRLRCMLRQGRLPGFYTGNRYRVNLQKLMEQLEDESNSRGRESE